MPILNPGSEKSGNLSLQSAHVLSSYNGFFSGFHNSKKQDASKHLQTLTGNAALSLRIAVSQLTGLSRNFPGGPTISYRVSPAAFSHINYRQLPDAEHGTRQNMH